VIAGLPGGIGSVLYFLLRQPVVARCPSCGTSIHTSSISALNVPTRFPRLAAIATAGVRITDLYCVYCGHSLASDDVPSACVPFNLNLPALTGLSPAPYTHNRYEERR